MRLRNEKAENGHLLSVITKEDRKDNFSLFFPVEGLDQFDSLLEITKGFQRCLKDYQARYEYVGYSISDYGNIENAFPEIDVNRVFVFEQSEFLSDKSRFIDQFGNALLMRLIEKQEQVFPNIATGAMAVASGFYDREADIQTVWDKLQNNKSLLFRAPRRFGKSSLLNHISKNPADGWQVCFVDLEGGDSSEKFVEKILGAMLEKERLDPYLPTHLSGQKIYSKTESERLDILREERKKIGMNWQSYAEGLFTDLENALEDTRFLFILDEVSFLIEDMLEQKGNASDKVNGLMTWFFTLRNKLEKTRFIISGSEHLPSFLSFFGIQSHLQDLAESHLGLFSKEIAREFIFLVLAGQKIVVNCSEIDQILDLMGKPIPYFLQLFLDAVCRICREKQCLSSEEIESVYHQELLGSGSKRYFESIIKQLERYKRYGKRNRNTAGAKSILDRLASDEKPVPMSDLKLIWQETTESSDRFEVMMDIMQDDFYITADENQTVSIDSKLIKDWWLKHGLAGLR
ncbi:MAG: hypothetical protein GY864_05700 [Desulfobacterales bacterium]|nr:hypothetical protein [Desulfobacterales bacterium]